MNFPAAPFVIFATLWADARSYNEHAYTNGCLGECLVYLDPYMRFRIRNGSGNDLQHCDCTKFCKCRDGRPIVFQCPAGLQYNAMRAACDWPEVANCQSQCPERPVCPPGVICCLRQPAPPPPPPAFYDLQEFDDITDEME